MVTIRPDFIDLLTLALHAASVESVAMITTSCFSYPTDIAGNKCIPDETRTVSQP